MKLIDINCDLGEGHNYDSQIMPLISSCNIACGGHFGNESSMRSAIRLAKENKVKIGVHPSYPDHKNFGRKILPMPPQQIKMALLEQLTNFIELCDEEKVSLHHIKFHGALYNQLAEDNDLAKVCFDLIDALNREVVVFTLPNSAMLNYTSPRITYWLEAFADRNYADDFSLISRSQPHALIEDSKKILDQVLFFAQGQLKSFSGQISTQKIDSICLHSDSISTVNHLELLHQKLPELGYEIR